MADPPATPLTTAPPARIPVSPPAAALAAAAAAVLAEEQVTDCTVL